MKKYFLFLMMFSFWLPLKAQNKSLAYPGDTLGIFTVINFEDPFPDINNPNIAGNIWQTGIPQKTFFNAAYSLPRAMVTDTTDFYPSGNHSYFDLYIGEFNMGGPYFGFYPMDIFIDFRHKFDTDTLRDGGYIEVSWDKGLTWMNIIQDTVFTWGVNPSWGWENMNLYTISDTLYNGEYGFSGHSNGWIHSCMTWHVIPCDMSMDFPPDTMIVRFNFISDADHQDKEGWMIDHIRLFSIDLGSGTNDPFLPETGVVIAPNPMKDKAVVTADHPCNTIELYNETGRRVFQSSCQHSNSFQIDRNNLPAGLYLCKILLDNEKQVCKRLLILSQ